MSLSVTVIVAVLCLSLTSSFGQQSKPARNQKRTQKSPPAQKEPAAPQEQDIGEDDASEREDPEKLSKMREELPKLSDLVVPEAEVLLRADSEDREFDWIVLQADQTVIVSNPVFPRPETLRKLDEERRELEAQKPASEEAIAIRRERIEETSRLTLSLYGESLKEYRLPVTVIGEVILFEELALRRVDLLLEQGDLRNAWELLACVEREIPGWASTAPRMQRYLMLEARAMNSREEENSALAVLDELHRLNPSYEGLAAEYLRGAEKMFRSAMNNRDYGKTRHVLERIEKKFPNEQAVTGWKAELLQVSGGIVQKAAQQLAAGKASEAAVMAQEAERIWPVTGKERTTLNQILQRHQILRVAVSDFSGDADFPAECECDLRHRQLTEVPLFEAVSADEMTYYRSSFFEKWEPYYLGREISLTLRESVPLWQSQPLLTANQVADELARQLNEADPDYNPTLASFIDAFDVRSSSELRIRFRRVPMNVESLFRFPVTAPPARTDEEQSQSVVRGQDPSKVKPDSTTQNESRNEIVTDRFFLDEQTSTSRRYRRAFPEPDGRSLSLYHVAEVVEQRYSDRDSIVHALLKGEADFVPSVQPVEVDVLRAASDVTVLQTALPWTHVIIINPESEILQQSSLRRSLSSAIDREAILKAVVLRDEKLRFGRASGAAWATSSYATNPLEKPPAYDPHLAYALRFAAEQQLRLDLLGKLETEEKEKKKAAGEKFEADAFRASVSLDQVRIPELRMLVEPDEVCAAAAERIVRYWKKIGIDVTLIRKDAGKSEQNPGKGSEETESGSVEAGWDLIYRRVRPEEPLLEIWPILTNDSRGDVSRLRIFPDWLRQELIGLEYASTFVDAQRRMHVLHRHLAAQAYLIPLWEVDDFVAFRKTVSGYSERPVSIYQNLDRWVVRP